MNLFKNAANYYKNRPAYPESLIEIIRSKLNLNGKNNLLDIGCGTGYLAIPLSQYFEKVFAADIDLNMLEEGKRQAKIHDIKNIEWVHVAAEELKNFDNVGVVSFGFSLHWLDQEKVLKYAFNLLPQDGAVLILTGTTIWQYAPKLWQQKVLEMIKKYLGPDRITLNGKYIPTKYSSEEALDIAGFKHVEKFDYFYPKRILNTDTIINMFHSTSYAAPELFKDKLNDFQNELRAELLKISPDNIFEEEAKDTVFIAHKIQNWQIPILLYF